MVMFSEMTNSPRMLTVANIRILFLFMKMNEDKNDAKSLVDEPLMLIEELHDKFSSSRKLSNFQSTTNKQ